MEKRLIATFLCMVLLLSTALANDAIDTFNTDSKAYVKAESKYYRDASSAIESCFEVATGLYRYWNGYGEPLQIEVPSDQYSTAIRLMKQKISAGKVPGISDTNMAEQLVVKGGVTYNQAVNVAKTGLVGSLLYDVKSGIVSVSQQYSITVVIEFARSIWNNESVDVALRNALISGLEIAGPEFAKAVLADRLSGLTKNGVLIASSEAVAKMIGPKASALIVNNFVRIGAKPIYGAAAMKSAAKLLRSNVVTGIASAVVFTVPDIIDIFRGRISGKQLLKNVAESAGALGGGTAGMAGGAALGSAILPGVGTVIGGVIGLFAGGWAGSAGVGAVADLIAEDDADEMLDIITDEFRILADEYLMTQKETEAVSDKLQSKLDADILKDMYSSKYRVRFAKEIIEPIIQEVIRKRKPVELPSQELLEKKMVSVLEELYDETEG